MPSPSLKLRRFPLMITLHELRKDLAKRPLFPRFNGITQSRKRTHTEYLSIIFVYLNFVHTRYPFILVGMVSLDEGFDLKRDTSHDIARARGAYFRLVRPNDADGANSLGGLSP